MSDSSEKLDEEDDDEFIIEKICRVKLNSDRCGEYLVKWKDFLDKENSWESESVLNCPRQMTEFECEVIGSGGSSNEASSPTNTISTSLSNGEEHGQSEETESEAMSTRARKRLLIFY